MFKVGDKIKVKSSCWHTSSIGETGTIVEEDDNSFKIKMDINRGFKYIYMKKTDVILLIPIHTCVGAVLCKECLKDVRRSVLL